LNGIGWEMSANGVPSSRSGCMTIMPSSGAPAYTPPTTKHAWLWMGGGRFGSAGIVIARATEVTSSGAAAQ
jgi:hypothetical protein